MERLGLVKRMRRYSPSIITGVKARYMHCRYKEVGRGMEGAGGNFLLVAFCISVKLEASLSDNGENSRSNKKFEGR